MPPAHPRLLAPTPTCQVRDNQKESAQAEQEKRKLKEQLASKQQQVRALAEKRFMMPPPYWNVKEAAQSRDGLSANGRRGVGGAYKKV